MLTKKILVTGASVSAGAGLLNGKDNTELWVNQLGQALTGTVDNRSKIGCDNKQIFQDTAHALIQENFSTVFVCWQTAPKTEINFGLELYNTRDSIIGLAEKKDINLVAGQKTSGKKMWEIRDYLLRFYNYHWDFCDLVSYVNILVTLAQQKNTQIYFINYYQAWEQARYFDKKHFAVPSDLDQLTQEILQCNLRDDKETIKLYTMIHNEYQQLGGIQEQHWLNLYYPLRLLQVDTVNSADPHPGPNSQKIFAEFLLDKIL